MANLEVLNTEAHRGLRLRGRSEPWPHFIPIVTSEFGSAAACCPIFFAKNQENGRFYAAALFGFQPGENLVAAGRPETVFRPLEIERQGFFVSGENMAIDLDHPQISDKDGEPLFEADGEPSDALKRIQRALGLLVAGNAETDRFLEALVRLRLVEPIDVSMKFDDGNTLRLDGLYTVSLDSISELSDADALSLFRNGYLQLAYTVAGSLKQIPVLASRRNERLAKG